jgi:hypothetical protein
MRKKKIASRFCEFDTTRKQNKIKYGERKTQSQATRFMVLAGERLHRNVARAVLPPPDSCLVHFLPQPQPAAFLPKKTDHSAHVVCSTQQKADIHQQIDIAPNIQVSQFHLPPPRKVLRLTFKRNSRDFGSLQGRAQQLHNVPEG